MKRSLCSILRASDIGKGIATPRDPKLGIGWKSPREYQLLPANSDFAKAAGRYIAHAKLLAPGWTASCELPLLFPEMKVIAPRLVTHYFANAGNPDEGILRAKAQALSRETSPEISRDFDCWNRISPSHRNWSGKCGRRSGI
jgi:hypothetical protein